MEIAIYSIFNVARVVAAAPNYTSHAGSQSCRLLWAIERVACESEQGRGQLILLN